MKKILLILAIAFSFSLGAAPVDHCPDTKKPQAVYSIASNFP